MLAHLGGLGKISELGLAGTQVTDEGLNQLIGLKELLVLHVLDTKVTIKGATVIKEAIPASYIPPYNMAGVKVTAP